MNDLENKLNGAKGQLVYWSRRVDQLTKQIKERDNAAVKRDGGVCEGKGLDPKPASGQQGVQLRRPNPCGKPNGDDVSGQ